VLLAGGGFLLGSLFFVSHSALLLSPSWEFSRSNTLWLAVAMLPVLILPFVWYVVLLRNAGYWSAGRGDIRTRHRGWLALLTLILALGFVALALLGIPFIPGIDVLTAFIWPLRELIKTPIFSIPLVALAYPLYVVMCVGLSVDTLRTQIAEVGAATGREGFRRSRRQLIGASLALLLVSVLVAIAVVWTISNTREGDYYVLRTNDLNVIATFDFVIALLIATVAVLLGQAMTRYELFTGKSAPQRGLARYWTQALALAGGYALLLGGALAFGLDPIYAVLLTALLMTTFFALLSWRATVEWRQAMRELRPMVRSEGWYGQLTAQGGDRKEGDEPFRVLCEDVLTAPVAYLLPTGPLAAFVPPKRHPPTASLPAKAWMPPSGLTPQTLAAPVSPSEFGGASSAVPLWSERGLIGALLLGPRNDGSLYSEEELEIARATGERLIDAAAGVALSQKLMALQRDRMTQTQLLDQRTRRVLHDEVLPLIHTAMLTVSTGQEREVALQRLSEAHAQISALLRDLPAATTPDVARLGPLAALRKAVEGEFSQSFDAVIWDVDEAAEEAARGMPALKAEMLYFAGRELIRNAARHAQPQAGAGRELTVSAGCHPGHLRLTVQDNGSGWDGRAQEGHGLELHSALLAIAGGSLVVDTISQTGASAQISLSTT
jgi:signal transduction histidine kinase